MRDQLSLELKVGIFVTVGVGLMMVAILVLGSTENLTSRKTHYVVHFNSVEGMVTGAKVSVGGVQVGTVESISFDPKRRDIAVGVAVVRDSAQWVRRDSTAEIATQGVLGDKYITISSGTPESPQLPEGAEITPITGKDLSQFLSKGDALMVTLTSIAGSMDRLLKSFEKNGRNEIFF
ncbi:MAG: MlaD family protein, partial [Bdellovibrionota bacterium]